MDALDRRHERAIGFTAMAVTIALLMTAASAVETLIRLQAGSV